ncbi:MAG: hypothetical protein ACOY0S_01885 [Patescibacteria group bacterium]
MPFAVGHYLWGVHLDLWRRGLSAWENLPWDRKLAWILFATNTLAVITLIELLIFGK